MFKTSERYKKAINNTSLQPIVNIYIDDILLNPKYLLDFKMGCELFDDDFQLGSVPSQYIEMQIHKKSEIVRPKTIRIEYGIIINNVLSVEKVNKMLVKDLNKLFVRSLVSYDDSCEIIPVGLYNIDDYSEEDDNVINIKALDNIIKLDADDGYYDASELINENGKATLGEIAQNICDKKGLELASSSFINSDKEVSVYDNQLKAREYMSYIAECAGGFCRANREGKIEFREIGQDITEIPLKLFKNYKFGDEHVISKVAYEDGVRSYKFGNETKDTLWIRQDNLFITDENTIENIYNETDGLCANSFEGTVIIDPAIDIGDIIIIDNKPIIYQGELSLNKRFIADIRSKINIKEKQETTVKQESKKILNRRIQGEINQLDGRITQIAEQQTENTKQLSQHEQTIEGFKNTVTKVEELEEDIDSKVSEMNSTINQTAEQINLEVRKKVGQDEIISKINQSAEGITINADKLDIAGKAVSFTTNIDAGYTYTSTDADRAFNIGLGRITATAADMDKLDVNGNGIINSTDAEIIIRAVNKNNGKIDGTFEIDPYSAKRSIILKDYNGNIATTIGLYGMKTNILNASTINTDSISANTIRVEEILTKGNNDILGQKILYENSSGSSGSITLNDYAYNYDYLEIYYKDTSNSNPENFAKVTDPNGKTTTLQISNPGTSNMRLNSKRVLISGDSILYDDGAVAFAPGNECYKVDEIKIIKVVGYK